MQYFNIRCDFDYRICLGRQPIRERQGEFWRAGVSLLWKVIVKRRVS